MQMPRYAITIANWLWVRFLLAMINGHNWRVIVTIFFPFSSFFFSFQGDKRRAERATLNSADGDTGEFHDQFYRDHKLLLVLFRALAVMPITRSSPGKSMCRLGLFYCVVILTLHQNVSFSFQILLSRLQEKLHSAGNR